MRGSYAQAECRSDMLRSAGCVREDGCCDTPTPSTLETADLRPMYVSDLTHFLDKSGAIGRSRAPRSPWRSSM